jgi:Flp pilus assembly protein TadD
MSWRQALLSPLSCGVALVAATAAYLAGPARDQMDAASAVAVLLHIVVGCVLIAPIVLSLRRAIQRSTGSMNGALLSSISLFACLCVATGLYLTVRAAAGHSTARDTGSGILHILGGVLSVAFALLYCRYTILTRWGAGPHAADESGITGRNAAGEARASNATFTGVANTCASVKAVRRALPARFWVLACGAFLTITQGALFSASVALPTYNGQEYYRDLTSTTAAQARNPLFPAGLRLQTGAGEIDANTLKVTLPESASCGVPGCHPAAFQEWHASAHRFANSDPLYQASLKESVKTSGPDIRGWCQGCHAPGQVIRQTLGPAEASLTARESEGVGCYACHGTVGTPTRTGNGRFILAIPRDYPFAGDPAWRGKLHDFLIRVRPAPHQRAYLKPELHGTSEFCSGCHRQSLTLAQNHYQFVRGPDEYGEWARGPASARSARSSGAREAQTCQDCHFRAASKVSHASPRGISTLGESADNAASLAAARSQLHKAISLDLFAIRRVRPDGLPGEVVAPLDSPRLPYTLPTGGPCLLDIVVRNEGVGHSFPAGYTDLTEAWLEVTIEDADGTRILSNGLVAAGQTNVPRDAHAYGSLALDKLGEPILKHNLPAQVTQAYHRTIPAGGADIARYRFVVPPHIQKSGQKLSSIRISAKLRYRSVRPDYLQWALGKAAKAGGERSGVVAPVLLTLAETTLVLPLTLSRTPAADTSINGKASIADRYMHYGEGLLAPKEKPDIGGAKYAFDQAKALSSERPEPWIGAGRVFLREPDLRLAERNLRKALDLSPGNPAASAELSVVYSQQGQPERAIQTLAPLVAAFPNDAALRNDLGLAQVRAGRYAEAAESFRRSLAIDPDQYAAHHRLKLCCEVLRRAPEGRLEDSITRYMDEDQLAARLVPAYLKKHSDDARRAESFPIHTLR